MGGGASIDVKHTHSSFKHITDSHFQELLASKVARDKLFQDIANYQLPGAQEPKGVITLAKLAGYFTDNAEALYPGFTASDDTLQAAFLYSIDSFRQRQSFRKGKPVSSARSDRLTNAMFHSFLPTLLLFMRVWDIFAVGDKLAIEYLEVKKGDFILTKGKLSNVHETVILGDISDEDWEKEFDQLAKDKGGSLTFEDACTHLLGHITRPFDYSYTEDGNLLDEDDEGVTDNESVAPDSFVELIAVGVGRLAPEMPEVPRIETPGQQHKVLPPASPRSTTPRSPRGTSCLDISKLDVDAASEEAEALASARIMFV